MSFSFMKINKGQIGIALHDGGVTIGQCSWKQGTYLHPVAHRIEANPRDFTDDDWRSCLNDASVTGSDCVLAVPPSIAHHQVLRLPNMNVDELKEAATWEMADRLGVGRSTIQMDAIPVGTGGDVLAIAIEQSTLESLLDPMYAAGLRPTTIEPECVSVARTLSMMHRRQSDQAIVRSVLDFGNNDSSFMVLAGDSLMFYKHLNQCGSDLIEAIATHTGVTTIQAQGMLDGSQSPDTNADISRAVRDATRATHESIATDAMKCIRHYGVTNRGPLSLQTIISGSAGWNRYLAQIMSTACNQEVLPDIRMQHLSVLQQSIIETTGWQVALGASLAKINPQRQRRGSDQQGKEAA